MLSSSVAAFRATLGAGGLMALDGSSSSPRSRGPAAPDSGRSRSRGLAPPGCSSSPSSIMGAPGSSRSDSSRMGGGGSSRSDSNSMRAPGSSRRSSDSMELGDNSCSSVVGVNLTRGSRSPDPSSNSSSNMGGLVWGEGGEGGGAQSLPGGGEGGGAQV